MAWIRQPPPLRRCLALALLVCAGSSVQRNAIAGARQAEQLDRGLVALHTEQGNFISWRALGNDSATAFNLYRDGQRLNAAPLTLTNYTDAAAAASARYSVRAVLDGVESGVIEPPRATWEQPYLTIPLHKPADGVTPDGQSYHYSVNDGAAADLDGDGTYELLV